MHQYIGSPMPEFARPLRLGDSNAKHLYVVEVWAKASNATGARAMQSIDVDANNRAQAAAIAKRAGFEVCSVNMVG